MYLTCLPSRASLSLALFFTLARRARVLSPSEGPTTALQPGIRGIIKEIILQSYQEGLRSHQQPWVPSAHVKATMMEAVNALTTISSRECTLLDDRGFQTARKIAIRNQTHTDQIMKDRWTEYQIDGDQWTLTVALITLFVDQML